MKTMGNQQGRLFWLAGIIDGEGNFGASYSVPSTKTPNKHVIRPYFQLGITHKETLEIIYDILIENKIVTSKSYGTRNAIQKRVLYNAKPIFTVRVCGLGSITKLVEILEDKLICKKEPAQLLKQYCLQRIQAVKNNRRNAPYRIADVEIIEKLRKLNHRGLRQIKTLRDFTPRLPIEK